MITKLEDFKGEVNIPNLIQVGTVQEPLTAAIESKIKLFAEKYEIKYLKMFYANESNPKATSQALITYSNLDTSEQTDEEKNSLLNSFSPILAYFISFWYLKDETIRNTGVGGSILSSENATRTNNVYRMTKQWNDMVDMTLELYEELYYPDGSDCFDYPEEEIFEYLNPLAI